MELSDIPGLILFGVVWVSLALVVPMFAEMSFLFGIVVAMVGWADAQAGSHAVIGAGIEMTVLGAYARHVRRRRPPGSPS